VSTPYNHFTAGPRCSVKFSGRGRVGCIGGCPTIRAGIVSPASIQNKLVILSTPYNHFTAGPDRRVQVSGRRQTSGGCQTIRARIFSSAGEQRGIVTLSTPYNHCTAGPDCRKIESGSGRVGGIGGYPIIRAGIVSSSGV